MNTAFAFDVFLSHNAKDKPRVRRLAERLKAAGVRVWLDEWVIQAGDIIALKVDEGLEQSRVLLLCITPAALASGWVALERSTAVHRDPANAGRRFIPLLLGDCDLPSTLRCYKYLDFRQETDSAFRDLLLACKGCEVRVASFDDDSRLVDRAINLGFDGAIENGFPHGWFDSSGYVTGVSSDCLVRAVARDGDSFGNCLMLRKVGAKTAEFVSVMQRFPACSLAGRVIRFNGEIKTQDVEEWAGLWLRADGDEEANLFFDNMSGHRVTGTTQWGCHSIEGQMPSLATWLNIGIVLSGSGTIWVDNLTLQVWTREGKWENV